MIHVVPRASRTEVAGVHGDLVRIRIAAPPVDGTANEELVRFMARQLNVRRGAVTIARGHSSRNKTVTIEGIATETALSRLLEDT